MDKNPMKLIPAKDNGRLDGLTILRFAHAFASGGGMEAYLEDLDRMLLTKNPWTIIRMYLTADPNIKAQKQEIIGKGRLIKVPLYTEKSEKMNLLNIEPESDSLMERLKNLFRDQIIYNQLLYALFFRNIMRTRSIPKRVNEALNASEVTAQLMSQQKIDLVVMHYASGNDSADVIEEAIQRGIPYVFINHFSNDCLNSISIREQTMRAAGIGGVSGYGVPKRLKDRFCNLSDGIDLELFDPTKTHSLNIEKNIPIIIYPARITRVKGQSDLIKAYANLKSEGLRARIVLAGRTDSAEYEEELKELAKKNGLMDDVLFVGQLNMEELRDWYGISSVLAFPTYHQEGLGRITIEAQAMRLPPVAYVIGGTPEGIQHVKTGFLVRKGDISDFTARLKELLSDEHKRKHMGEAGRRFVEKNFSLQALAERHEKFYSHVLEIPLNR